MSFLYAPGLVPVAALLNRHRGGWLPTHHTQIARLDYSVGMGALLFVPTWDWRISLISVPLWFVGSLAPNGEWMGARTWKQVLSGCGSGLLNVGFIAPLVALFGHWYLAAALILAGALKGPMYWLGNRVPWPWSIDQFHRGPEMGEVLFGAVLGAALCVQ